MQLVIAGQDIRSLTVAVVQEGNILHEQTVPATPETYLASLHSLLRHWGIEPESFDRVLAVTGPGSFTASRVSTTIANTIAFTRQIPVAGIENPDRLPLTDLLAHASCKEQEHVIASYSQSPNIIQPKKSRGDNASD